MTSVEKRRSGRKSSGHRKHSDGGYSDTSSGGSFLDETDREVSNLTDRAFRSLCIGDEAVYNDSDLCSSSPCTQRDRQLAFSQSGQDRENREREELKRAAHESFSVRMQQYGQDWVHRGMYGAEIQRDPQWEVYGERTQGRVSATFQHSFVETSQQEESLGEDQLSFLSNGATELSSQRRSRSRVSSLIRAFNSEGQRDGAGMDGKLREWNDETSWDKSALMSIQRELSEFSTSYQQNFNSGHFPTAGSFSSQDTNFYPSDVAAVAHMKSASTFMSSSHSKHSMSTQVNCNSNFFIHSEFSPFKVWRDHNRFPFQQAEVSGFMHCSEFPKWYETPMYRELSLEAQPQGPYRFEQRGIRHPRNTTAPVVPPTLRSTSTSTMLQKASAVEKRCESELTGHYPHWKRTQSLGTNRLPLQRPSTASPTSEMSRRVQDTISSVKALQQKIKMMTEQNIVTGMTANQQGVICSNDNLIPFSNNAKIVPPNVVRINTSTTPFNIHQPLHAHQETGTSEVQQYAVSPQPVEHPPVRAESRGATPDIRMSSYKSRATSLLFNLKDNRKRVKSTYSPGKFKGLETPEKNKQPSIQEPRDIVIDIPDFPDPDIQFLQVEESSRINAASHQYVNEYHNPGSLLPTPNAQPAQTGQYSEYTSSDYQTAQMQSEMVNNFGFNSFIPENYASNQWANGQNLNEDLSSSTPYKQGMTDNVETPEGDVYRLKQSYTATETPRLNDDNNHPREYLISKANAEQHFNETVGREFTKADRYQQLKENSHDYSNVSSQDMWRQTNSHDTKKLNLKAVSPWKQEITALTEKEQHAQAYQRAAVRKEELNTPRDKYRGEHQQSINTELEKIEMRESFGIGTSSHKNAGLVNPNISNQLPQNAPFSNDTIENPAYYGQQQPGAFKDKYVLQKYYGHNKENEMKDNYLTPNRYTDQEYRNQQTLYSNKDKSMLTQETAQRKQFTPIPKVYEMQSVPPTEAKPQFEHNIQKNSLSNPETASAPTMPNQVKDRQSVEVMAEQVMAEHIKAQNAQAELAQAQHWAQVEQPKEESARLILAGQTGSEKVKAELKHERVNEAKAEHVKEEKKQKERTEQSTENQPQHAREKQTKAEESRAQKVAEEPRNITEEEGIKRLREEQGEQVKAKQAEAERLKEEHIKTELAKTEQAGQARIKQAKAEQTKRERIKAEQIEKEQVREEQVEREQVKAEQIRTEKVKVEQAEAERRKAEQAKLAEQIQEQQARAVQEKNEVVEMGKVNAKHIQDEDVKQVKAEEDPIQAGRVNAEQPATQIAKAKERKVEQTKLEQTKVELAKAQLTKTEDMQERSAQPAAKLTQLIKSEPDKVEQVKIELAKAKAELAKIKEKMRGQQKEKGKNPILTKEDEIKTVVPLNINKNEEYKDQDQVRQMHQQREDSAVVSRQYSDQAKRGVDEYERLREKYGFTDATSPNRNKIKVSAVGNVSSNDANETLPLSLDKAETTNNDKSEDKPSSTSRFATENMEEVGSFKSSEFTESPYVYSESSKEFKLSSGNYLPTNADKRANSNSVTDKGKDDSVEKLEKCDAPPPLERKPKSTEHRVGPGKDQHFNPPRALSHKERAQTKQEILTSRIKAHAEKEISAIKEKGFAIRDGVISKNSSKQLAGIPSNVRQRPPSQEVSKKHDSTMSSIIPKKQMEPSGIQMEPVKSVSPSNSAAIPVKSVATTSQVVDHLQKQVTKEPMKSNDNVSKSPREAKQTGSYTVSTDEDLVEKQKKDHHSEIKSPIQSKEQAHKNKQEKQEANQGENFRQQKDGLKDNPTVNTDHLNKKNEDPSQATALVKAKNSKPVMIEGAESKHEEVHEDSAPSLNIVFGQTPVADDNLQITGIMVTVRERKSSMDNGQRNNNTQEQMNVKEKECSNSSSKEVGIVKLKDGDELNIHPTVKEPKVGMNNHPENVQENSTLETRQNNGSENVTMKKINLQQESYSVNARPQRVTPPQEPLAEKGVTSTVNVPAKNKELAETQPLLYKQDIIARETKDYTNETQKENSAKESIRKDEVQSNTEDKNTQKTHTNENFMAKAMTTAISDTNDSSRTDAETRIKHDIQPAVKEDGINPSKSRNIDGKSAPLVEEKICDSTPPTQFNKTFPSNHSTKNENNEVGDNVHIGSIAIRVVPAVIQKDNLKMAGKHQITVSSDGVSTDEQKQVASSSVGEKVNPLNNEDRTNKDLTRSSNEQQIKDSLEDKVQCVLSGVRKLSDTLKPSNQQNSINVTSENTQTENGKPEKVNKSEKSVDESKMQPMVGDYFQVQGVAETNNEAQNHTDVGDTSDAVSRGRELPRLLPNKAAVCTESCNEKKNEVFVLDQSKRKTVESSSVRLQDENMKKKNSETEDNLASKQSDGPTERQIYNNEKREAGQAITTRKHHTENRSSLSARDRQSLRNSHPTKENTVKEKTEVKPKPKERVSTIPEISAIADYARLKVIVSEDEANTIQEFPPNKKEGFFPLIQTRHSRRPVFTAEPHDLSVKEKSLPNKTEVSSKLKKETKPLVFPITEKEHQRTGMFKLGDKERQEKMVLDAKANELDTGAKNAQRLKERNKSPTTHLKNQGSGEQVARTDTERVHQVEQNIHQSNNPPLQTTSSSAVNRPRSTSQHLKPLENALANTGDERTEKMRQERLATRHEETEPQQQSTAKQLKQKQASRIEEEKRAEDMRVKHMIEENRASLGEEERRAAQREEERRTKEREAITFMIKERREKQREAERKADVERAAQKEEMREKQREEERRMKETEEKRKIKIEGTHRAKLREEEEQIKENEERRRVKQREKERTAQEEQQRRAAQEEQQRKTAQEEQQMRAAEEEQQRKAAQEEQQRRAAQEEQQRKAAQEEQQRRAAQEEQQRRVAQEEQKRRAAQEVQQRRATQEEQQRRAAEQEQQKRAAQVEQQRRAALIEEQQRRAAQEEQQRRAAQEEQQRRAAQEEQQRRAAQEEQQRRAAQEEQQRRTALIEEQQRRAAQEEQQRRAAQEEQQRRAALIEEQQRRAAQEEKQGRAAQGEQQKRVPQEEQQRRAALIEEQIQAKQAEKTLADIEAKKKRKQREEEKAAQISEAKKAEQKIEEQRGERQKMEEWMSTQREEKQAKEERTRLLDESQARGQMLAQREDEIRAKEREEEEGEKFADHRGKERETQIKEQKRTAQRMEALQYYAITSTESDSKPSERQLCSPLPSQQRHNQLGLDSTEDSGFHPRPRPHAPASPAPSLPRSNTSSPALGTKPSMFRVKDNTIRGSSFTKSVKPRFHKNFGDEFRVGSPMERVSAREEQEQEIMRRSAVTPVHPDTVLNRLAERKSSTFQPAYSSHDYSASQPQHRPYSRRSIALDEDDSRSVISNMSEDVESFATSAADLADIRGLFERPESACSFSSDVSRSLGKPPTVPPKSDKALRRAQRLTTRRIKKELSKITADSPARVEKSPQEVSSVPSSSSTEVRSSSCQAVASPHFSSPVSLAHAPALGSLSSSHTEHQSSHSSFYATPHATGPISLPIASTHATTPVSVPVALPNATAPASHTAAPKTVAHVPSSPTLHHANHPAPVTQYHVESSYPHSYPLTQRKVLQDLGSGQYFVVDVPVQVKTKTFFDPETGKYVQLNVRESGQSSSRPQPQQTYPQPPLQPHMQVKLQQQPKASPAGKPFALYQGTHVYPQDYQPPSVNSVPYHRSSTPVTLQQDQQPVREGHIYGYSAPETGQNSEGHRYSPEKTPYMDTVNDKDKTYNPIYNTHGTYESFPQCDTNSQLAGSPGDNPAHSQCQPRDIITISELEDFMEVSDW